MQADWSTARQTRGYAPGARCNDAQPCATVFYKVTRKVTEPFWHHPRRPADRHQSKTLQLVASPSPDRLASMTVYPNSTRQGAFVDPFHIEETDDCSAPRVRSKPAVTSSGCTKTNLKRSPSSSIGRLKILQAWFVTMTRSPRSEILSGQSFSTPRGIYLAKGADCGRGAPERPSLP